MLFNSLSFILFLPLGVLVYYLLPSRFQKHFLIVASLIFLSFRNIESVLVVILFTVLNFWIGLQIEKKSRHSNKLYFLIGLALNLFSLLLFKYVEANPDGVDVEFHSVNFLVNQTIVLLGFSFYMLQNIGYLTDIYWQEIKAEKQFSDYFLYISFFPKLNAGPIEAYASFEKQVADKPFNQTDIAIGFQRILFGFFKKIVLADRLAISVNEVFDANQSLYGLTVVTGVILFTIQLYLDFSGYVDIAIGTARLFGYQLSENFNRPFLATSISEFWRRWHITLINWLTRYIYYPVVYSFRSVGMYAAIIGIIITFLASGLWHGISLTFLTWAALHAIYLSYEAITKRFRAKVFAIKVPKKLYVSFSILTTFTLVCFSNLFFRSKSMENATKLFVDITSMSFIPESLMPDYISILAIGGHLAAQFNLLITFILVVCFFVFESRFLKSISSDKFQPALIILFGLLLMLFGLFDEAGHFIYTQF